MQLDKYTDTDAEALLSELVAIKQRASDMFDELKEIKNEPSAQEVYKQIGDAEHPLPDLYEHARRDTYDLDTLFSEALYHCTHIGEFATYLEEKLIAPDEEVFHAAFAHIKQNGDGGSFRDMLRLFGDVIKMYRTTHRLLKELKATVAAKMELIP
ncbi:hypothetical protein LNL84_01670 [Vibrio sp. ZSDZ34]|uniref:Uncharacterized protein n=1 Tax=Vibrio gelatinilyticus TaxID=2893468 RepID=A0A9X2AXC6_9VIBR|nr:hypothetical protein [Vibrio gelatinilyticus]MCJ2375538.1 hypothetical protein [Vibrio gelatinilyticus]